MRFVVVVGLLALLPVVVASSNFEHTETFAPMASAGVVWQAHLYTLTATPDLAAHVWMEYSTVAAIHEVDMVISPLAADGPSCAFTDAECVATIAGDEVASDIGGLAACGTPDGHVVLSDSGLDQSFVADSDRPYQIAIEFPFTDGSSYAYVLHVDQPGGALDVTGPFETTVADGGVVCRVVP